MEYTLDITEYSTRSQLRAIADEANRRERERKRFLGLLQAVREAADTAAHAGKYEIQLKYDTDDVLIMTTLIRRALIGCTVTLDQTQNIIHVSWT